MSDCPFCDWQVEDHSPDSTHVTIPARLTEAEALIRAIYDDRDNELHPQHAKRCEALFAKADGKGT